MNCIPEPHLKNSTGDELHFLSIPMEYRCATANIWTIYKPQTSFKKGITEWQYKNFCHNFDDIIINIKSLELHHNGFSTNRYKITLHQNFWNWSCSVPGCLLFSNRLVSTGGGGGDCRRPDKIMYCRLHGSIHDLGCHGCTCHWEFLLAITWQTKAAI